MLPWKRPEAHPSFESTAKEQLSAVRAAVEKRGGKPHGDDFLNKAIWTASWRKADLPTGIHKRTLVGPSDEYAKCAWCERRLSWKTELNVEHYRPKVAVTRWQGNPPILNNESDEAPKEIDVGAGYWWLAFSWDNYSLACAPCNQHFKRNLFPVVEPRPPCAEGVELMEEALLLNPGSAFRVRDHFRWTDDGIMEAISEQGRATIITCGLNRRQLRSLRAKTASDTLREIQRFFFAREKRDDGEAQEALKHIRRLADRRSEFTAMVRWLVEEYFRFEWEQLPGMPP